MQIANGVRSHAPTASLHVSGPQRDALNCRDEGPAKRGEPSAVTLRRMSMTRRRFAESALLLATLAAVTACDSGGAPNQSGRQTTGSSSGGGEQESVQPPPPQAKQGPPPAVLRLALVDGDPNVVATTGATLLLTTYGSTSCPHRIEDVQKASAHRIRIVLPDGSGERLCTADVAPHHEQVVLPKGMATHDVKRAVIFVESGSTVRLAVEDKTEH